MIDGFFWRKYCYSIDCQRPNVMKNVSAAFRAKNPDKGAHGVFEMLHGIIIIIGG